ncbi:hypothetical protein [Priestia filamentosa]|uniref:hypothetical protein n=1 Tax=Priestia filamentosa TaxID=1402861 RepID=UPI0028950A11|nr:hypothetical protein [Priestia filamentosa]MDT3766452.1 hypothetical protein [Priestia filamentosa]
MGKRRNSKQSTPWFNNQLTSLNLIGNNNINCECVQFVHENRQYNDFPIPPGVTELVLTLTFDQLNADDRVWLNGIVSVNNNLNNFTTAVLTITRGNQEIYRSEVEVDRETNDDSTIIPFSFVDELNQDLANVQYTVFIFVGNPAFFLDGPSTLTAQRMRA